MHIEVKESRTDLEEFQRGRSGKGCEDLIKSKAVELTRELHVLEILHLGESSLELLHREDEVRVVINVLSLLSTLGFLHSRDCPVIVDREHPQRLLQLRGAQEEVVQLGHVQRCSRQVQADQVRVGKAVDPVDIEGIVQANTDLEQILELVLQEVRVEVEHRLELGIEGFCRVELHFFGLQLQRLGTNEFL